MDFLGMDDFEQHVHNYTVDQEDGILLNNVIRSNYYGVEDLNIFFS